MQCAGPDNENNSSFNLCNGFREEVTDLLIGSKRGHSLVNSYDKLKTSSMGHKRHFYQRVLSKNNVTQDSRSQSLPNSLDEENPCNGNTDVTDYCDTQSKLLPIHDSPPQSPTYELWFKTWPERCEKFKTNDSSPDSSVTTNSIPNKSCNTRFASRTCDINNTKNKFTLNEALQNISLAYSPVTKQLHLVEKIVEENCTTKSTDEASDIKKPCHKRTESSFSSTVSSLSDPSPSGSLLETEDRTPFGCEEICTKTRKKSLTHFFSRNVFSWKSASISSPNSSASVVWKLFTKPNNNNPVPASPQHPGIVASSTALIQHMRPSTLPAKTLEEEQRHREEYMAMVAAAKKKEAQNSATRQKLQKLQLQQEEQQAASTKHFIQHVLPNWDTMRNHRKTKDLWWQGLPSSVRGKIWRLAIGNELNLTSQLYEICLSRAQNRLNSPEPSHCESDVDQESSMDVIQLDISRTFPHLCIFQEGGPYSDVLHSLLAAYVCYRPDVGYVQGMSYIAAILILNMEQYDAFICFANLLNQPLHIAAFTLNQNQMQAYYNAYNEIFSYNLPKLYSHFQNSGLTPDLYLLDWIYTIFAKAMPLDIACRVWDLFLRDGEEFIFRTALGILHLHQDLLMHMDFLHGAQFLTRLPDDMSADQLFKSVQAVSTYIGKQTFSQIVDRCGFSLSES